MKAIRARCRYRRPQLLFAQIVHLHASRLYPLDLFFPATRLCLCSTLIPSPAPSDMTLTPPTMIGLVFVFLLAIGSLGTFAYRVTIRALRAPPAVKLVEGEARCIQEISGPAHPLGHRTESPVTTRGAVKRGATSVRELHRVGPALEANVEGSTASEANIVKWNGRRTSVLLPRSLRPSSSSTSFVQGSAHAVLSPSPLRTVVVSDDTPHPSSTNCDPTSSPASTIPSEPDSPMPLTPVSELASPPAVPLVDSTAGLHEATPTFPAPRLEGMALSKVSVFWQMLRLQASFTKTFRHKPVLDVERGDQRDNPSVPRETDVLADATAERAGQNSPSGLCDHRSTPRGTSTCTVSDTQESLATPPAAKPSVGLCGMVERLSVDASMSVGRDTYASDSDSVTSCDTAYYDCS
ncbi:hypothetical protein L227DRAFT_640798 [Lentinus tigrinus ALCF2SS1-6]|uniref:Uncharacterized protein n=1 Tax=Lentinus tigrinus ALCF2SS1-6 TaxID=1328759 RepID=A0A5C2SIN8_9APHY|nr:hypothetical protein L227DRAFT_640798 [Lentinus tigrinus ALCF2SS1-6]